MFVNGGSVTFSGTETGTQLVFLGDGNWDAVSFSGTEKQTTKVDPQDNGDGQRAQKQDSVGTTNYVWDGQNILLETNASDIIQVAYTFGLALYGNIISQLRNGTASFFLFDGLGSTAQLASSTGSVTDSYLYDSFGNSILVSGSTTNWFRYGGRIGYYFDVDLPTYLLRARLYDPRVGRFISRDALFVDSENLYLYVGNQPVSAIDPSGRLKIEPRKRNLNPKCGDAAFIQWDFVLAKRSTCAGFGYIVQEVKLRCTVKDCVNCPSFFNPVKPDFIYYEAWTVSEGQNTPSESPTDTALLTKLPDGTCGNYSQLGAVKFFCLQKPLPLTREVGQKGWTYGFSVGAGDCNTQAGKDLLATQTKPTWWETGAPDAKLIEGPAYRSFTAYWRCCPDGECKPYVTAHPPS
jgi:RHS repeat-associated protein